MRRFLRIFSIIICFACAGLVACGDNGNSAGPESTESSSVEESSSSDAARSSSDDSRVADSLSSSSSLPSSSSVFSISLDSLGEVFVSAFVTDTFEVFSFGDLRIEFAADSFLTLFSYGDFVTVMIPGFDTLDVPVVANYGEVFPGEFFLYASSGLNYITLDARYGQMAEIVGLGREAEFPVGVVIQMKKKRGYADHLEYLSNLVMAYSAEFYPDLSVEQYANFRLGRTTGMGEGVLYRSSSPVDPSLGRNLVADSLAGAAGVKTFVNFAETAEYAESYEGFAESYYATQNVVYLNVPPGFANSPFKEGLVKGFRFMAEHDGPYLLHCTFGMDRTGYSIAVLEALMGATAEEIKADYVTTHKNYFNVTDGWQVPLTQKQVELIQAVIERLMRNAYKVEGVDISDFENADLAAATEKYLLSLGMEKDEIEALKARLK